VICCENGFASAAAAKALKALGFSKVVTLRGGLRNWRQENLPLVKGASKK
jgi:rhodanese-related sulfurtransferase